MSTQPSLRDPAVRGFGPTQPQRIESTGGPGSCAIFARAQWFTKRCGRIGLFEAKEQFSLLPAPSIDSDSRTLRRVSSEPLGGIAGAPVARPHRGAIK